MIRSYADKRTAALFAGHVVKRLPGPLQARARAKPQMIDAARSLGDLWAPPGYRLERLRGDRAGQHGIRVNDRWRICFVWRAGDAWDVEMVDYHKG